MCVCVCGCVAAHECMSLTLPRQGRPHHTHNAHAQHAHNTHTHSTTQHTHTQHTHTQHTHTTHTHTTHTHTACHAPPSACSCPSLLPPSRGPAPTCRLLLLPWPCAPPAACVCVCVFVSVLGKSLAPCLFCLACRLVWQGSERVCGQAVQHAGRGAGLAAQAAGCGAEREVRSGRGGGRGGGAGQGRVGDVGVAGLAGFVWDRVGSCQNVAPSVELCVLSFHESVPGSGGVQISLSLACLTISH